MTAIKTRAFLVPLLAGALLLLLGWFGHSALAAPGADLAASPAFTCSDIPAIECDALVALYTQAGGPNWANTTNLWLSTTTACTWNGVLCDAASHVQWLALGYNQLSGTIPSELGNLTNLQLLLLDNNQLTGTIPSALGNLASLQTMNLSYNSLTGSIPPQLGQAISMTQFLLGQNQLSGAIPPELGQITNLLEFDLSGNQLSGAIPAQLGSLTKLHYLYLNGNQLTGTIPSALGSLANLQSLALDQNQLSGAVPAQLGGLANLLGLQINSNLLNGALPQNFTSLNLLSAFLFDTTSLCEPPNTVFQTWLTGIATLQRNTVRCVTLVITRSGGDVVLSWTDQPPDTGYDVDRSPLPYAFGTPLAANLPPPAGVYTDTGAIGNPNANYFYTIRPLYNSVISNSDQAGEFSFSLVPGQ